MFLRRLTINIVLVLALLFVGVLGPSQEAHAQGYQTIGFGDAFFERVTNRTGDMWSFYSSGNTDIVVDMQSNSFDTYLELYDPDGWLICEDDDSGGNYDARLDCWLSQSGEYTIVARGYEGATGPYTISLDGDSQSNCYAVQGTLIDYGSEVDGRVTNWDGNLWSFYGSRGDWVEINMMSLTMDTYLELYDPDGCLVTYNDDHVGTDSRIYIDSLSQSGYFTIVARGYEGDTGRYWLTLD